MSAPPYMKLYVADYLGDTHHMGALEHGAYLLLLMGMWRAGGALPAADKNLAKIARCTPAEWDAIKDTVLALFKRSRSKLTHKRLAAELAKYENTSGKRSEAGKRGASEKANKNNVPPQAIASENESNCRHNQSHNQNQKEDIAAVAVGAEERDDDWPDGQALDHAKTLEQLNNRIDPQRQTGLIVSLGEIARWRQQGFSWGLDVIPTITAHAAKSRADPVRGWNYFSPAIAQAHANRTRPAETVTPQAPHERRHSPTDKFERHQANLERAFAGSQLAARLRAVEPESSF